MPLGEDRFAGEDPMAGEIIGAAIAVHKELGPGLLESAYHRCLCFELDARGLRYRTEVPLPVTYRGHTLECGYRMDLLVGESVVVEVKAVEKLLPVHEAQLLTYMRLASKKVGLMFNFHSALLRDALVRRVL